MKPDTINSTEKKMRTFKFLIFFCIFATMDNRKPTFALIGKIDDPISKSRGGQFILLLNRDFEEEDRAIFNFDPNTEFYRMAQVKQLNIRNIREHETSFHFSRCIK